MGLTKIPARKINQKLLAVIREVGREADRCGLSAYVVGGFVRDLLLGKKNLDCDFVIEGDAIALTKRLAKRKRLTYVAYPQFGTATLYWSKELSIDLATARQEHYLSPGALPQVQPGSLQDDLWRRDFTINTLAMGVNQGNFGVLVDEFGGLSDLHQGKIRILHPQSFWDDPTRILRAVRFEQRFGFHLDPQTQAAMAVALQVQVWRKVKAPRYFSEFRKILAEDFPSRPIRRLHQLGALEFLEKRFRPPLQLLRLLEKNIARLKKDPFYRQQEFHAVFFLGLFSKLSQQEQVTLSARFHFTRMERETLFMLPKTKLLKRKLLRKYLAPSEVYQILHDFNFTIICFMLTQASDKILRDRVDSFLRKYRCCQLAINGHDIKHLVGASGQDIGSIMQGILYQKLDGKISTRAEEIRAARQFAPTRER